MLIDIATQLERDHLEAAINEADKRDFQETAFGGLSGL